jgi:site-specific DNA recombinase
VVLAQDRDRFAREPAYHYLLRREFEEHECKLRFLNDRGDESPEGELTDGILDQLAKFERAKTAERTRRGRLRKARQGKIVAFRVPNYGFRFNVTRGGYQVDEEAMQVVRRIVHLVGVEGVTLHGVARILESEGVRTSTGGKHWDLRVIKVFVMDDVYKPHTFDEVAQLVAPEVAAQLDSSKKYGIWWYNRRRVTRTQVSEEGPEGGRRYRRRSRHTPKEKDEWIAVPVPDSGTPREVVGAAREAVKDNRKLSYSGERFWELSCGVMYCNSCGRRMAKHTTSHTRKSGEKARGRYYRCPQAAHHRDVCSLAKHFRADRLEPRVWEFISTMLRDPDRLREGLERMIEEEREELRGDLEREIKAWLDKVAEVDRRRSTFQDMAAEELITFEELRAKLAELGETREVAEKALEWLQGRQQRMAEIERDRDAFLKSYAEMVPEALETLTPEERHRVYRMLGLRVAAHADETLAVSGVLQDSPKVRCDSERTSVGRRPPRRLSGLQPGQASVEHSRGYGSLQTFLPSQLQL